MLASPYKTDIGGKIESHEPTGVEEVDHSSEIH
jgi:hypothetical protein